MWKRWEGVTLVAMVCLALSTAWAVEGRAADVCGTHGTLRSDNSTCDCDESYYGQECGLKLVQGTATMFCLDDAESGEQDMCFTLYPLDCLDAASVNLMLYTAEGVPMLANKYVYHEGQRSAEICSRALVEGEASCMQEKVCLLLEEAELSDGVLSAHVYVEKYCGEALQEESTLDLGILEGHKTLCGTAGTLYPPASMEVGNITAEVMEVDEEGCIVQGDLTLFCPIVLMDPCGLSNGMLISAGEVGVGIPLIAGQANSYCHPRACVDIDNVSFTSDKSVSFSLNVTRPDVPDAFVMYSEISASPRVCGAKGTGGEGDDDGDGPERDYWSLLWEILAAGVMVMLCMGLVVVAMLVVMYRKKHGDPSGYGVMESDPDSLLDELGDEEADTV